LAAGGSWPSAAPHLMVAGFDPLLLRGGTADEASGD
jgi:hypothetical protein